MARAATPPAQAGDVRLSPAATDAVQLVDAFAAALAAGQLEAARQFIARAGLLGQRDQDRVGKGHAGSLEAPRPLCNLLHCTQAHRALCGARR